VFYFITLSPISQQLALIRKHLENLAADDEELAES
jgi:hypothetical protein